MQVRLSTHRRLAKVLLVALASCASGGADRDRAPNGTGTTGPSGTGPSGTGASSTGSTSSGAGGGSLIMIDAAPPHRDAMAVVGCTGDLRAVIDGEGHVVPCPADQGCSAGKCLPACQAAQQSKANFGCDFWAPESPFLQNGDPQTTMKGACYAVFVANTWGRSAKLAVSRDGQSFDLTAFARM